jgi:hypothetical protein
LRRAMTPAAIDDEPRSTSVVAARIPVSRFVIDAGYPPRPLPNFAHVDTPQFETVLYRAESPIATRPSR